MQSPLPDTGVVVNGNHVTAYGLFVEHYEKYEVIRNGKDGRDSFFQNEMPYDPPSQALRPFPCLRTSEAPPTASPAG